MSALLRVRDAGEAYAPERQVPTNLGRAFELVASAPDGVKRLRELILSLAVRGKLVPQDPRDKPASTLLQLGRTFSNDSVSKDEVSLPAGWATVRLAQIAESRLGKMLDKAKNTGKSRPYLRNTNVQWHRFDLDDIKGIRLEDHELDEYRVRPGDLLICEGGEPGRCAIWKDSTREMYFQKALHRVRPHEGVLPEYIEICLRHDADAGTLGQYFTGATIKHFPGQALARYLVPLPPTAEQRRIVHDVHELMKLCDSLEENGRLEVEQHARLTSALLDSLVASESPQALAENWQQIAEHFDLLLDRPEAVDALEKTILELAVRGLLVEQDSEDESAELLLLRFQAASEAQATGRHAIHPQLTTPLPVEERLFALPPGWAWARFSSVARIASDLVDPSQFQEVSQVAPDCIEKMTGHLVESRSVRESGVKSPNHRFRAGQILYSKVRPSLSKVVLVDFSGLCSADMYPIDARIDSAYLHLSMLSNCFLAQVKLAENRVKMPKLNQEALNSFLVAVSPLAEQQRIVARVRELRALCAQLRVRLTSKVNSQARFAEALVHSTRTDGAGRSFERAETRRPKSV